LTQGGDVQLHVTTFISVDLYVSAPPEYGAGKKIHRSDHHTKQLLGTVGLSGQCLFAVKKHTHKDVKAQKHKNTTNRNKNTTETQTK
jgi:hypothetical protein